MNTGRRDRALALRPADHGGVPARRTAGALRAGRQRGHHRRAGAVDPRQFRADRKERGNRSAGAHGGGQRRRLFRAGVFRPVRAVLEAQRARRDRRADALHQQGPPGARGAGSHGVPDARSGGGDGEGFRRAAGRAAHRRRHGGERAADAVPGRHPGPRRWCARQSRKPPRWAPPTPRGWPWASTPSVEDLRAQWAVDHTWTPQMDAARREEMYGFWKKAVTRSFDWLEEE